MRRHLIRLGKVIFEEEKRLKTLATSWVFSLRYNQVKAYLQARFQGRSRRLLREPLPLAKKRKAPP